MSKADIEISETKGNLSSSFIFLISVALNVSLSVGIKGALINGDEA